MTMNRKEQTQPQAGRRMMIGSAVVGGIALLAGGALWLRGGGGKAGNGLSSIPVTNGPSDEFPYKVLKPGPGDIAPPIVLNTTAGAAYDLHVLLGTSVLVYFQEGLMCDACWVQLRDIETNFNRLRLLGITSMVTITTDPLDLLAQKVRNGGYTTPVCADPTVRVSEAYNANHDSMMGGTHYDAHTFVIVGPDGLIRWRADYGGAPGYNMYVPVPQLVADMTKGLSVGPAARAS